MSLESIRGMEEEHDNGMDSQNVGALANYCFFFSLSTGQILNRMYATGLPMPDHVIDQVHNLARKQKTNPGIVFANRNRNQIVLELDLDGDINEDEEDDESYQPDDNADEYGYLKNDDNKRNYSGSDGDEDDDDQDGDNNNDNNNADDGKHSVFCDHDDGSHNDKLDGDSDDAIINNDIE